MLRSERSGNLGLGSLVLAMSLTGPWRKDSWWPARILWGAIIPSGPD